jgi:hypothetical protein
MRPPALDGVGGPRAATSEFHHRTKEHRIMRAIEFPRPPAGPLNPVPKQPSDRESVAVTWCREIATAVATALDTDATDVGYLLTPYPDLPAPHSLNTAFTVAGHRVRVAVVWDNLWREPGYALTIDDRPVALDSGPDT